MGYRLDSFEKRCDKATISMITNAVSQPSKNRPSFYLFETVIESVLAPRKGRREATMWMKARDLDPNGGAPFVPAWRSASLYLASSLGAR
jgi:hypothetical protein